MSKTKHWGEYTDEKEDEPVELTPEFKKLLIEGALSMETERAKATTQENAFAIELPAELGAMDETILHTILLHPYIKQVEYLIEEVQKSMDIDDLNPPEIPPVPAKPPLIQRVDLPEEPLDVKNTQYLLRKSCATLAGNTGFETAKSLALNTLTDAADDFLKQLTAKLRTALDQTAKSGSSGFPYPLLRAFAEMSIEPLSLRDYHDVQVKKRNETLLKTAHSLYDQYSALVQCKVNERVRARGEERDNFEEENIPELHFPALGVDQLQSSLEPGFQMLDSLELDESLQNMEADEEIIVSDSASQEYIHSGSSDVSSPNK